MYGLMRTLPASPPPLVASSASYRGSLPGVGAEGDRGYRAGSGDGLAVPSTRTNSPVSTKPPLNLGAVALTKVGHVPDIGPRRDAIACDATAFVSRDDGVVGDHVGARGGAGRVGAGDRRSAEATAAAIGPSPAEEAGAGRLGGTVCSTQLEGRSM